MDNLDPETKRQILMRIEEPKDLWKAMMVYRGFNSIVEDSSFWLEKYRYHGMRNAVDLLTKRPDLFEEGPLDFLRVYKAEREDDPYVYMGDNINFGELESLIQWKAIRDLYTKIKRWLEMPEVDIMKIAGQIATDPGLPWYNDIGKGMIGTIKIFNSGTVVIRRHGGPLNHKYVFGKEDTLFNLILFFIKETVRDGGEVGWVYRGPDSFFYQNRGFRDPIGNNPDVFKVSLRPNKMESS